jgi:CBS domain-containing protein
MQFTVKDWMLDVVVYIKPNQTVSEALSVMRRRYIVSLIVQKDAQNPQNGIVTSKDICDKIVATDLNPSEILVHEIMSSPLITVTPDMPLTDCAKKMREHRIHHLPVVDEYGEVIGMIAASDFLVAAEEMGRAPGDHLC